jgi:hypothetical protein
MKQQQPLRPLADESSRPARKNMLSLSAKKKEAQQLPATTKRRKCPFW